MQTQTEKNKPNTSEEIKELRARTKLSQEKFAEKFNIPVHTLRKWEQGASTCPQHMIELLKIKITSEEPKHDMFSIKTLLYAYVAYRKETDDTFDNKNIEDDDAVISFLAWCNCHNDDLDRLEKLLNVEKQLQSMLKNEKVIDELKGLVEKE